MIYQITLSTLDIIRNIQWFLEIFLFAFAIFAIIIRNVLDKSRKTTLAHKLLMIGLAGWLLYTILDEFVYDIAGNQFIVGDPIGIYSGYLKEYPLLFISNILRDFQIFGAMVMNWSFLMVALIIMLGEYDVKKRIIKNKIVILIEIISTLILVAGDRISVEVTADSVSRPSAFSVGLGNSFLYIAIGFYLLSAFFMIIMFFKSKNQSINKSVRRRIYILSWGILFMGIGHSFWVVYKNLAPIYPWFWDPINQSIMNLIGHLLWMVSPIFIALAIFKRADRDSED
jgi:hypothetical protein